MSDTTDGQWRVPNLVNVAQLHDKAAQESGRHVYSSHRKLAFDARRLAQKKARGADE